MSQQLVTYLPPVRCLLPGRPATCSASPERHNIVQSYLIENDPVRVNLGLSLGIKDDGLVGSEVRPLDSSVVWTHVDGVRLSIAVEVRLTDVTPAIACSETRHG